VPISGPITNVSNVLHISTDDYRVHWISTNFKFYFSLQDVHLTISSIHGDIMTSFCP